MKKLIVLVSIVFCAFHLSHGQDISQSKETREILLYYPDSVLKFDILTIRNKKTEVDNSLYYYWYMTNEINRNKGGFSGYLLHGKFEVYNKDNELIRKGRFDNGLMDGTWKRWYPGGELNEIEGWDKGVKDGKTVTYDPQGRLLKSVEYKKGLIHGKVITIRRGSPITEQYRKGEKLDRDQTKNINRSSGKKNDKARKGIFGRKKQEKPSKNTGESKKKEPSKLKNLFHKKQKEKEESDK